MPEARTAVAHGQMQPNELEETIMDFINYDYDILIATTIVESGVDIPNVNTIIINNAHMFGLATYQLRGRVGRSNRKAYCYLIAPPLSDITDDARRGCKPLKLLLNSAAASTLLCKTWIFAVQAIFWEVNKADLLPIWATKPTKNT